MWYRVEVVQRTCYVHSETGCGDTQDSSPRARVTGPSSEQAQWKGGHVRSMDGVGQVTGH